MARKKTKGTELSVFKGREAKLNRAIFETLAVKGPQTMEALLKQINKKGNLRGIYYASLTKRIKHLEEAGYTAQVKQAPASSSRAALYKLQVKALLASVLDGTSLEELLSQITEQKAALLLLALLNATGEPEEKAGKTG
ncbi:MAG: hypothetical protein NWE94_04625 [Candidatus Bathyarchaeota archaeon]|nr:hypothetical protein [Candidatus Bathyarchaeota archaeon]